MHISAVTLPIRKRQETSKKQFNKNFSIQSLIVLTSTSLKQRVVSNSLCYFVFNVFILCFSYKVPAKGDGVDYVRTEDEVSPPFCLFLQNLLTMTLNKQSVYADFKKNLVFTDLKE